MLPYSMLGLFQNAAPAAAPAASEKKSLEGKAPTTGSSQSTETQPKSSTHSGSRYLLCGEPDQYPRSPAVSKPSEVEEIQVSCSRGCFI